MYFQVANFIAANSIVALYAVKDPKLEGFEKKD